MSEKAADEEEEEERGQWSNPCDFFISCLGYAVGLGNIWRFPFLCFKHGGGSFLLPYFLMLIFAGLPVFLLEIGLGQYAGVGPIKTFGRLVPLARGLGFAVVTVGLFLAFFYNVVVSWSVWYLAASFSATLPWERCGHRFNTPSCFSLPDSSSCVAQGLIFWNNSCTSLAGVCASQHLEAASNTTCANSSGATVSLEVIWRAVLGEKTSPSAEYYARHVLGNMGNNWGNFGYPRWQNMACLATAWLLVALCLIKGVKTSGKVVYFTSLFPYCVLLVLAVRGLTLPGALQGISYYLSTDWRKLSNPKVWVDAAEQVIFSLGPACGCVITLSSYNRFERNCHKDAVLIALSNSVTSVFSGLVVFSILGFMAHTNGLTVEGMVEASGPGLAFIVYPEVVTLLPAPQVWSALFFLMLITLALGSIFGAFETVITALSDQWPTLRPHKPKVVVATSLSMLVLGLPFTCHGGIHMFNLFNESAPSWNLLLFALLEVLLVSWVYGVDRFLDNFAEMGMTMGPVVRQYWRFSWRFSTPCILFALLIISWSEFGHIGYQGQPYPMWVQVLGYLITGCTVVALPIFAVIEVGRRYSDTADLLTTLIRPSKQWGPNHYQACEDDRIEP